MGKSKLIEKEDQIRHCFENQGKLKSKLNEKDKKSDN